MRLSWLPGDFRGYSSLPAYQVHIRQGKNKGEVQIVRYSTSTTSTPCSLNALAAGFDAPLVTPRRRYTDEYTGCWSMYLTTAPPCWPVAPKTVKTWFPLILDGCWVWMLGMDVGGSRLFLWWFTSISPSVVVVPSSSSILLRGFLFFITIIP